VSHPYFAKLTDMQIRDQVPGAASQITSATGADPWQWFRFTYGDYNQHAIWVANGTGFVPVGWTVDTLGWKGTSGGITAQTVVSRVLGGLRPDEIVLMPCGSNPDDHSTLDADALPGMIQSLRDCRYSFVTIDALRGLGYHVLTSNGGVHSYGALWYGSDAYKLPAGGDRDFAQPSAHLNPVQGLVLDHEHSHGPVSSSSACPCGRWRRWPGPASATARSSRPWP
jgi:Polysaccharide deacetylase